MWVLLLSVERQAGIIQLDNVSWLVVKGRNLGIKIKYASKITCEIRVRLHPSLSHGSGLNLIDF